MDDVVRKFCLTQLPTASAASLRFVRGWILCGTMLALAGWVDSAMAGAQHAAADPPTRLAAYSHGLRQNFPDVPVITPSNLAALSPAPVLLDARDATEFDVSRLPGALLVSHDLMERLKKDGVGADDHIVVYCSVGYRSAQLARRLAAAGYQNVQNLEGSIFQWAHEGRPLVNDSGPTTGVHPFDHQWGRMLDHSRWAWEPIQPTR